jgi:hypothetical protein
MRSTMLVDVTMNVDVRDEGGKLWKMEGRFGQV